MLQLNKHQASVDNVNVRIEKHGKDRQLGVDIGFSITGSNKLLDGIDENLRESLYRTPARGDQGDFIAEQNAKDQGVEDGLVSVKLPYTAPTKIKTEFEAYDVTIRGQLKRSKSIDLVGTTVKKIEIQPVDGGSVNLSLTVAASVEPKDIAILAELFKLGEVRLTMIPPDKQHEEVPGGDEEDEEEEEDADGTPHADSPQGDILDLQDAEDARTRAANDDAGNDPGMPHAA